MPTTTKRTTLAGYVVAYSVLSPRRSSGIRYEWEFFDRDGWRTLARCRAAARARYVELCDAKVNQVTIATIETPQDYTDRFTRGD